MVLNYLVQCPPVWKWLLTRLINCDFIVCMMWGFWKFDWTRIGTCLRPVKGAGEPGSTNFSIIVRMLIRIFGKMVFTSLKLPTKSWLLILYNCIPQGHLQFEMALQPKLFPRRLLMGLRPQGASYEPLWGSFTLHATHCSHTLMNIRKIKAISIEAFHSSGSDYFTCFHSIEVFSTNTHIFRQVLHILPNGVSLACFLFER